MISVLYVDDEPGLLEIGKLFLERDGQFAVTTVTSAATALGILATTRFEAIISDYQMPGMDGITFLKQVRASGNTAPFIIFTGRGREEIVIQALNEGADFYLQKGGEPVSQFAELAHKIRQAVQQRRAEASIRDHERREADIINFLPDATFAIDTRGVVIAWNRAMEKMTGVCATEILGRGNYEYALPFYHERRRILIDLVLNEDPATEARYPYVKREGKKLFSEITIPHMNNGTGASLWFTASPLYDTSGNIVGAIESIRDVTERKRAEAALQESEQRYRAVVEDQTELISRFRPDGTHVFVNEAYCRYFGLSREKLLGHRFLPAIPAEDLQQVRRFFATLTPGHPVDVIEHRIIMPDGSVRWQRWSDRAIFDSGGRLIEYQSVGRDITQRKKTEDALRESKQRNAAIIAALPDLLFIISRDGTYLDFQAADSDLLAIPPDEIIGTSIFSAGFDADTAKTLLKAISAAIMTGTVQQTEYDLTVPQGRLRFEARLVRLDADRVLGVVRNITRQKEAERAILESKERYRILFDQSPVAIWEEDFSSVRQFFTDLADNGVTDWASHFTAHPEDVAECAGRVKIIDVNQTSLAFFGVRTKADLVRNLPSYFIEESYDVFRDELIALAYGSTVFSAEVPIRDLSGSRRVVNLSLHVVPGHEQALDQVLVSFTDITEKIAREDRIRVLAGLLDLMPASITIHDSAGRFLYANARTFEYHGYTPDEFFRLNLHELDVPEAAELIDERVKQLKAKGETSFEVSHYRKDRSVLPLMVNARFTTWDGAPVILSVASDISERLKTEEALRAREQEYITLADNSPDLIVRFDTELRHLYGNLAAERETGYTLRETFGKRPSELPLPEPVSASMETSLRSALMTGLEQNVELAFPTPRGLRMYETRIVPERNDAGEVVSLLAISRDVTERREAERALRDSEARYRSFVENSLGIAYRGARGFTPEFIEGAIEKITGYSREDFMSGAVRWDRIILPEDLTSVMKCYEPGSVSSGSAFDVNYRIVRKDGEMRWVREIFRHFLDSNGSGSGTEGMIFDITDLKRLEEDLRRNREQLELALWGADEGIIDWDLQQDTVKITGAAATMLGYDPAGFPANGASFLALIHPDDRPEGDRQFAKLLSGEIPSFEYEQRMRTSSGGWEWILARGKVVARDGAGRPLRYSGTHRNISRRKQIERALHDSEERLRFTFEATQDGIWDWDIPSGTAVFSPNYYTMLGYEPDEFPASYAAWRSLVHPDDIQRVEEEIEDTLKKGDAGYAIDLRMRTKGGAWKWIQTRGRVVGRDPAGLPVRMVGTHTDISDRKEAEGKLVAAYQEFQTLLENIQDVYYRTDETGRLVRISNSMPGLFGYEGVAEILGKDIAETFYANPSDRESVLAEIRSRGKISNFEVQLKKKDGTLVTVSANSHFWFRPDGSVGGVEGTFRDITEKKKAEDALRKKTLELDYRNRVISTLLDTVPIGVFMVEAPSGKPIIANRAAKRLLGRGILPDAHEENLAEVYEAYRAGTSTRYPTDEMPIVRGMYGESSHIDDLEVVRPDGTKVMLEVFGTPVFDSQGRVAASLVTFLDITDRKKTEKLIHDLAQFPAQNPNPVLRFDRAGTLLYANAPGQKWLASFRQNPAQQLPDSIRTIIADAFEKEEVIKQEILNRSNRIYQVIATRPGGEDYINIYSADVTERKRAEQAVIEAGKKINLLTSITRHDVANQITILKGYAQIALMKRPDPVIADLLVKISTAGSVIAHQIEFTRAYQELGMHAPEWYRIRDIVERQASEGITISCQCDAEIFADPLLENVFLNLIDNAARHGERVTEITITCHVPDNGLVIAVADNGIGVPMDLKDKIFEKGYGRHTGFGLFLAREILAITGISICENGLYGKGARFEIRVPDGGYRLPGKEDGG